MTDGDGGYLDAIRGAADTIKAHAGALSGGGPGDSDRGAPPASGQPHCPSCPACAAALQGQACKRQIPQARHAPSAAAQPDRKRPPRQANPAERSRNDKSC